MEKMRRFVNYFSKGEQVLWFGSVLVIVLFFCAFDRKSYHTLAASLIGVTALIFNAKGNPFGQVLMIIFSIIYGIISYSFSYYGEMMTYLLMTLPMAAFSLVSWLKNPYRGNRSEVKIENISPREKIFICIYAAAVTVIFYFILKYFNTANLIVSTASVTTSFAAAYLTFRRNPYFAIGYALNDIVLIVLWIMASAADPSYISVIVCFAVFLANDVYGFVNWRRMEKRQSLAAC